MLLVSWPSAGFGQGNSGNPFYMGADISLATFFDEQGASFFDDGVNRPLHEILYDRGTNLFRLRIFVNPQTTYTNTNFGAIQTQAYDIALAQQIKAYAPNAKLLVDFHYSDTWADPGQQTKPAAWNSLSFSDLQETVRTYTRDTLQAFHDAGVMPEMVQLGNETIAGMLWGTAANPAGGRIVFSGAGQQASWQNYGALVNAAIQGVREAQGVGPKIDVGIHIDQGDFSGRPQFFFGNLTNPTWGNVSDFEIVGVSYYPSTRPNHSLALLESNLNAIADTYPGKQIMVLETNYSWRETPEYSDVGVPQWPETPAGQQQFMADLVNVMLNLHNGAGAGIVYWYPEAVPVTNFNIYHNGATALFDNSRNALPALDTFAVTLVPGDVDGDRDVDLDDVESLRTNFNGVFAGRTAGDLNGDGIIDLFDFAEWKDNFAGVGSGGASSGLVPEPAAAILILVPLVLRICWARCQRVQCSRHSIPISSEVAA
jgi:arabinogalactan endo-1,4-beta-galactosidase